MDPLYVSSPPNHAGIPEASIDKSEQNVSRQALATKTNAAVDDLFAEFGLALNRTALTTSQEAREQEGISEKQASVAEKRAGISEKQAGISEKQASVAEKRAGISEKQAGKNEKGRAERTVVRNVDAKQTIASEMKSVYIVIKTAAKEATLLLASTAASHELQFAHTDNKLGRIVGDNIHVHPDSGWEHGQKITVIDEDGKVRTLTVKHFTPEEISQLSNLVTTFITLQQQSQSTVQQQTSQDDTLEKLHEHTEKELAQPLDNRIFFRLNRLLETKSSRDKEEVQRHKKERADPNEQLRKIVEENSLRQAQEKQHEAAKKAAQLFKERLIEQSDSLKYDIRMQDLRLDQFKKSHPNICLIKIH